MNPGIACCGHFADLLRSCYETDCDFGYASGETGRIRWYFLPDDAPPLPFPTVFHSANWESDHPFPGPLGEVPGSPRSWRNGEQPFPVEVGGGPCGDPDVWLNGLDAPPDPPAPLNVYGGLACCPLPDSPFLHASCANCPDGAWDKYTLTVSGGAGTVYGQGNGTWTLTYGGHCRWYGPFVPIPSIPPDQRQWVLSAGEASGRTSVSFCFPHENPVGGFYQAVWDCLSPIVFTPNGPNPPGETLPSPLRLVPFAPPVHVPVCGVLGANAQDVYFVEVLRWTPVLGWCSVAAGTYPLVNDGPCSWSGSCHTTGLLGNFVREWGINLAVFPDSSCSLSFFVGGQRPSIYTSLGAWDGASDISLVGGLGPIPSGPDNTVWGPAVTVRIRPFPP